MKKLLIVSGFFILMGGGCLGGQVSVIDSFDEDVRVEVDDGKENILLIAGEGGPSENMFRKTAKTYKRENGGVIYEVHTGEEFNEAIVDFYMKYGLIDHMEYFGHGNHVALFVNQEPGRNASIYANDPRQNEGYVADSIYSIGRDYFSKYGWVKFNGCNVAKGYPEKESFAQNFANYFDIDVVAPQGPTEFSSSKDKIDPILNSKYLSADFAGDVYMVPTYGDAGFTVVKPQALSRVPYKDVRIGQDFEEAVYELTRRGLYLGDGAESFKPYKNINYAEAVEFCAVAVGDRSLCEMEGFGEEKFFRNLRALQMITDAFGVEVGYSGTWYRPYISYGQREGLLTEEFVNKKWYTRGEMAILTWNFMKKFNQ